MATLVRKRISENIVEMNQIVMPTHTNPSGNIFGGVVLSWIDIAAIMCGTRHAEKELVTVHIDNVTFKSPVRMGDQIRVRARPCYVGKTSMEIEVTVEKINPYSGSIKITTMAYVILVAMDEKGKKSEIPPLTINSEEEKSLMARAEKRREFRKLYRSIFDEV